MTDPIAQALRGNPRALSRIGVAIRVPKWRRRLQARLMPRRYQLWLQRTLLAQLDEAPAAEPHEHVARGCSCGYS